MKILDRYAYLDPSPLSETVSDGDSPDFEPEPEPETEPMSLVELVAVAMLGRAVELFPEQREAFRKPGTAIIVEVPDRTWIGPICRAWPVVFGADRRLDSADSGWGARNDSVRPLCLVREEARKSRRAEDDELVARSLSTGRTVVGVSQTPDAFLPGSLLHSADIRLTLQPVDLAMLADAILDVCGPLQEAINLSSVEALTAEDLLLAHRPGSSPEAVIDRLRRLLERREQKRPAVALHHLHGMDEAVAWGHALARDLGGFRRGHLPWSEVDRGVLLYGPPGTGKTTFARALAGSCGVPLFATSLGEMQAAGHLGDLLAAMRNVFERARKAAPAIIFIDEIDSFGDRARFSHAHKDYSVQVVNALLELLDGASDREGVVVVGACNDPARLDPAIIRSGRLDRPIRIGLPDKTALARILRFHLRADLSDVDLAPAAELAVGATGADCERWVRGARRRARHDHRPPALNDLLDEIRGNAARLDMTTRRRCAVHEAGHALIALLYCPASLLRVSILTNTESGGSVLLDTGAVAPLATRNDINWILCHLLAGRAAEEVVLGNVSAGAGGGPESDLAKATSLATASITAFGMDADGAPLWRGMPSADGIQHLFRLHPDVARKVSRQLEAAYARGKVAVAKHRTFVGRLVDKLLQRDVLGGSEVVAIWESTLSLGKNTLH